MEMAVFVIAAGIVLSGALGVVLARNPVHSALLLVQTLFGVAVLFILQEAHFLAAIQVIVYAGAIVILFLFVIMLLGVDRAEQISIEPIAGQRPIAAVIGAALIGIGLTVIVATTDAVTGARSTTAALADDGADVVQLGDHLFTDYVFGVELTAVLLTIAVVGAVVLARRPSGELAPIPEPEHAEPEAAGTDDSEEEVG